LVVVADGGDVSATRVLCEAAEALARATRALGACMGVGHVDGARVPVLLAGKPWRASGRLLSVFREHLFEMLPRADVQLTRVSQAEGAALLAMRHAGLHVGPEVFKVL